MNPNICRNLSIKILEDRNSEIKVFNFDQYVKSPEDIIKICAFFENYTSKYFFSLFDIDSKAGIIVKKNLLLSNVISSIRKLNPYDFEKLSALICKCLGFNSFYATQKSRDQGIDFIAYKNSQELNIDYHKYYIVGQSKHFTKELVKLENIRELSGSVILFSRKEFSSGNPYASFNLGTFSPLNVIFISSYFFSEPAKSLCQKTSIVPLDIIDIACISLKGVEENKLLWKDESGQFDHKNFINSIQEVKIHK